MSYRSVFKPGLFDGQTVIVTGGGSGIGRCTAHEIAALGRACRDHRPQAREARHRERRDRGGRRHLRDARLRHPRGSRRSRRRSPAVVAKNGRIHGLFNNAGGQFPSPAADDQRQGLRRRGAQQPHRRLHRQPRGLHAVDAEARRLDRQHDRRHAQRLSHHGAHRRRARRHGQPHHDPGLRMGRRRRAGERGVAGLDRLVRHGYLPGRVQGADPQAQGLLPARDGSAPRARCRPRSASC